MSLLSRFIEDGEPQDKSESQHDSPSESAFNLRTMNAAERSGIVDTMAESVMKRDHDLFVFQQRPYTMVVIKYRFGGEEFEEIAFTKVCRPDKWDSTYGIELAIRKACKRILKRIMGNFGSTGEHPTIIKWSKARKTS